MFDYLVVASHTSLQRRKDNRRDLPFGLRLRSEFGSAEVTLTLALTLTLELTLTLKLTLTLTVTLTLTPAWAALQMPVVQAATLST